jgi:uncharacterized membrane protein YhiD involved in acid resistance
MPFYGTQPNSLIVLAQTGTFEQFIATDVGQMSVLNFIINLLLATVLSWLLGLMYVRCGSSLSNRRSFAANFILMALTTTMIIAVVKSSLALSLGLVGALSIVRFRAAIKEPEELAYLFFCIAIGLGLGADQRAITVFGFVVITAVLLFRHMLKTSDEHQNLYLTVSSENPDEVQLSQVVDLLKANCNQVTLKRLDETDSVIEARFIVAFEGLSQFEATRSDLRKLDESVRVTYLDHHGIE